MQFLAAMAPWGRRDPKYYKTWEFHGIMLRSCSNLNINRISSQGLYELLSKLLVSPLISTIVVPYIIPYITPFK